MVKSLLSAIKSNPIIKNPYTKVIKQKIDSSFDRIMYGKIRGQ